MIDSQHDLCENQVVLPSGTCSRLQTYVTRFLIPPQVKYASIKFVNDLPDLRRDHGPRYGFDHTFLLCHMRKRRFNGGGLGEAVMTLRSLVGAAAKIQQDLPASLASTVPASAPLPKGLDALNSLDTLGSMSDEALEELRADVLSAKQRVVHEKAQWEELGKQLKSAMDATLMVISLKSEPSLAKRRRFGAASMAADDLGEEASDATPEPASHAASESEEISPDQADDLTVGRIVAFKLPRSIVDEWIQCEITRVLVPGQRFEVRDPEPDERGNPGKKYQAKLKDIMPLPLPGQPIKPLLPGAVVLARYPETTAFYKARVASYQPKRRVYKLRFEGEEDAHKEIEVNDTLVLPTFMQNKGRR